MEKKTQFYALTAGAIFLITICSVMLGMAIKQDEMLRRQTYEHASALFDLIVLTRQWNAEHGGVFVEKKPGVVSNPFLKHPDITDVTGKEYTKKTRR